MPIHKVFISYHHADQDAVDTFIRVFDDQRHGFIARGVGIEMDDDIIQSDDTEYVMRRIRDRYMSDSTVTIVLIGRNTWTRRYVDWEIQASLRHGVSRNGDVILPNGLIGIKLAESYKQPERLALNRIKGVNDDYYARLYNYPTSVSDLRDWVDDAYQARWSRANLIVNPRERYRYNRTP